MKKLILILLFFPALAHAATFEKMQGGMNKWDFTYTINLPHHPHKIIRKFPQTLTFRVDMCPSGTPTSCANNDPEARKMADARAAVLEGQMDKAVGGGTP